MYKDLLYDVTHIQTLKCWDRSCSSQGWTRVNTSCGMPYCMVIHFLCFYEWRLSCTRLRIPLNTICRKPGFNSLRTPLNHGAEQASNETLKQTQQRNWSNASQGGQTAPKEHVAVLHYETASTTQQPRGEHRGTIKDCKIAGATTWQRQSNHTFTTILPAKFRVRYDKR